MATRLSAEERRAQLLELALESFAANGFHDTSMSEIAERAGVTKPVLYQHFDSKRHLYLELLNEVGGRLREAIAKAVRDATSPRDQTELGMVAYFKWVANDRDAFRLLFGGASRQDAEFLGAVAEAESLIAEAVKELINAGLDEQHRRVLAYAIVGLAEGASRHLVTTDEEFSPELLARQVADLAWGGLRGVRPVSDSAR
jgi:AcrR family transcriptional regulator